MLRNAFKRKDKEKEHNEAKTEAPGVVFQEAPPDLDLFTTARINLKNFKEYFEQTQENAFEPYQIVNASLSKAYSNLTNKASELLLEKEHHTKDMESVQADIAQQKESLERENKEISELKEKQNKLHERNSELKKKIENQRGKNTDSSKYKVTLAELQEKLKNLQSTVEKKQKDLEALTEHNKKIIDEYDACKKKLSGKQEFATSELLKSEQLVKDLQTQAKKIEQEREAQKLKAEQKKSVHMSSRRVSMTERKTETFIIQDNLQLSNTELETLRSLTSQIQKENDELNEEYESKKMDVDCLIQQNLGLKQILRDMLEGQK